MLIEKTEQEIEMEEPLESSSSNSNASTAPAPTSTSTPVVKNSSVSSTPISSEIDAMIKSMSFLFQNNENTRTGTETGTTETCGSDQTGTSNSKTKNHCPSSSTSSTSTPCTCPCSSSSSSSLFSEQFMSTLGSLLTPLLMSYLSSSTSRPTSTFKQTNKCPVDTIIKDFNGMWDGLNSIENKKVRAICFMNNLNRFHGSIWKYAESHNDKSLTETTLSLTLEKLHTEIVNVMEQLQN